MTTARHPHAPVYRVGAEYRVRPEMPAPLSESFEAARRAVPFVQRWWRTVEVGTALSTLTLAVSALISPVALLSVTAVTVILLAAARVTVTREPWARHFDRIDRAAGELDASPIPTRELRDLRAALDCGPRPANVRWPLFGLVVLPLLVPVLPPPALAGLLLAYGLLCLLDLRGQRDAEERADVRLAVGEALLRREAREGGGDPDDRPRAALPRVA
ncbi:hypothetical protein LAJ19_20260 (plasmid) [Deinococcus taeanensis]|uniref:hypothetical protein n=1 Tax=Deinococcus taeanensis TaxID=2737050 RepID=UPI001CDC5394|nr:hypothetical protein [Deinococcus taeanensis]UBV45461.1 hypothetical protein LAJ19_20260 [Deinococcus taeanensis]